MTNEDVLNLQVKEIRNTINSIIKKLVLKMIGRGRILPYIKNIEISIQKEENLRWKAEKFLYLSTRKETRTAGVTIYTLN